MIDTREQRDPAMTDAEWIAELRELCPILWLCAGGPNAEPPFPIYHPLYHDPHGMDARRFSPAQVAKDFEERQERAEKLKADERWTRYLFFVAKPYRVRAFDEIRTNLCDQDYWVHLRYVWNDSENTNNDKRLWTKLLTSNRPGQKFFMHEDEMTFFAALPDRITIYRGYHPRTENLLNTLGRYPSNRVGRSWTLSKKIALDFTRRFHGMAWDKPVRPEFVREETVYKAEALACINIGAGEKEEQEIIFAKPR